MHNPPPTGGGFSVPENLENYLDCGKIMNYNVGSYGNFYLKGFFIMAKEFKITSLRLQELNEELNYLKTTREREIAAMIAETFGPSCETVILYCQFFEDFIAEIYNGHVSGRKPGDCIYITGEPVPEDAFVNIDPGTNYMNCQVVTTGGKTIKSSTVYFKTDDYHYGLGINFDVSQFSGMRDILDKLISTSTELAAELHSRQSLNQITNESICSVGTPVEKMSKYDRMCVIQLLNDHHVFQMQKAVPYVAERLKISRYTVYNYMRELGITHMAEE